MGKLNLSISLCVLSIVVLMLFPIQTHSLIPYSRDLWDMMLPTEDPFRILEQSPITIPKAAEYLTLARADWKETPKSHLISIDIPGMKKEDVKTEVEENRVLRVSGERKAEEEIEGGNWHRSERTSGKFWRRFRLPSNTDLEKIKANLENGVLRITVPKLAEEKKREAKVISIDGEGSSREDIEPKKAEM